MKFLFPILFSFLLASCGKSYNVALYKDKIEKDCILAIFPSMMLEIAMSNCAEAAQLYKADDEKHMYRSIITGLPPEYYCQKI